MDITTPQNNFRRVYTAGVPATYNPALAVLTQTAPSTNLLFDASSASVGGQNPSLLFVMPFLVAATTAQTGIGVRLLGWRKYLQATDNTFWYLPTVLADLTLTFTSGTVPNYTIEGVADTRTFSGITQVSGTPNAYLFSPATAAPANVEPAYAMIDVSGSQFVTAQFKSSGSPGMGVFWSTL